MGISSLNSFKSTKFSVLPLIVCNFISKNSHIRISCGVLTRVAVNCDDDDFDRDGQGPPAQDAPRVVDHLADDVRGCRSKLVLERVVEKHVDVQSGEEVASLGHLKALKSSVLKRTIWQFGDMTKLVLLHFYVY